MANIKNLRGNRWLTLAIISVGFLMILLDTTIVNVSIPTIIRELAAKLSDIEWVISGYALTFAAFLITFGRLGDIYGRKIIFIVGLIVFVIASFFSGEAHSPITLIIARLFQGVGGAMISPSTLSLIASNFKGKERALAFGIWGSVAGVAVALGPLLGGYLTTYQSWRWIFRINIPLGILAAIAAWLIIKESKELQQEKLDISGMITSALGFFFLVFALIEGQNYGWIKQSHAFALASFTWNHPNFSIIAVSIILSIIFLAVFAIIQYFKTKKNQWPAFNTNFFRSKSFRYGLIAIAIISLGEFSSLFTIPIFLQSVKGYTPMKSGVALLPLAIGIMIGAPSSARIVNKIGSKFIIMAGLILELFGLFLLSRINISYTALTLTLPYLILGLGIGLALAQNTQVILSDIPHQQSGSASGMLNTIRQVGSALGIAIIGAVLSAHLITNLTKNIEAVQGLPEQAKQTIIKQASSNSIAVSADSSDSTMPQASDYAGTMSQGSRGGIAQSAAPAQLEVKNQITEAVDVSLTDAISSAIKVGSLFVGSGVLLSFLIPNKKPHQDEETTEGAAL
jgi:EmrB/QacA subfamily drug resistance transporter